jgi:hypothetical protein
MASALPPVQRLIKFIGDTPAVNLAQNVPHGVNADILMLGCRDVHDILYTIYSQQHRMPPNPPLCLISTVLTRCWDKYPKGVWTLLAAILTTSPLASRPTHVPDEKDTG